VETSLARLPESQRIAIVPPGWRVRAAMLLNAADPDAPAPPLPPNRFGCARREGNGWLVAFGARRSDREDVLAALRVRP